MSAPTATPAALLLALLPFATAGCRPDADAPRPAPTAEAAAHDAHGDPGGVRIVWATGEAPVAGRAATLAYTPVAPGGAPVAALDTVHERLSHLIVVSADLATFDHVHADRRPDGSFALPYTFREGGPHVLFADATPTGAAAVLGRHEVAVAGPAPAPRPLGAATTVGEDRELSAHLALPEGGLRTGAAQTLAFHPFDAAGAVTDLQPYLGAAGHVVLIAEGARDFLHVHPEDHAHGDAHGGHGDQGAATDHAAMGHGAPGTGAATELRFSATFPRGGRYKLWLQVQRAGVVHTLPFVLDVAG